MERTMLRAKIHRAQVTASDLNYEGSITLSTELLEESGILPNEQVQVVNLMNGARFTTYAIPGDPGTVQVNGPAARLAQVGDLVIVMAFAGCSEAEASSLVPRVVQVDRGNRPVPVVR